jgi:hypothetical protein
MADSRILVARGCGGVLSIVALSELFAEIHGLGAGKGLWLLIAGLAFAFLTLKIPPQAEDTDHGDDAR